MRGNRGQETRLRTPDDLREMVRVTTPGVWIVLTATLTLLAGLLVWSMLGTVTDTVETAAATVDGRLVCFVPEHQAGTLSPGMRVIFESGQTGTVFSVGETPLSETELDALPGAAALRQQLGLSGWTRELALTAENLSGSGPFPLSIVKEEKHPIDFLLGDER